MSFGCPGIGGSLGQCALCGESFVVEVCLGLPVKPFKFTNCEDTLYGHVKCIDQIGDKEFDVLTLPPKSPLRRAYERGVTSEPQFPPQGQDSQR